MCVNTHRKQNTPSPPQNPKTKIKQKKIPMEFALCWPATAGHVAWPGLWWLSVVTFLWSTLAVLPLQVSIVNSIVIRVGFVLTCPSLCWDSSSLNLGRSCLCCPGLCELTCVSVLLCRGLLEVYVHGDACYRRTSFKLLASRDNPHQCWGFVFVFMFVGGYIQYMWASLRGKLHEGCGGNPTCFVTFI